MRHSKHSFGSRCKRAFTHLTTTAAAGRRAFPEASLQEIEQKITQGEQRHSAEIRLIVEVALGTRAIIEGISNRQRALDLFAHYRIWDTEDNCGVLIYVNLAEHAVEIVADRNVGRRIETREWHRICTVMTQGFAQGKFHESTIAAIEVLNALLHQHFPATTARSNQLPDHPLML
ncbi:MAG: putative membrane protein [Janthinobacterium sp.]|jgi:uncharacterized membrane protein